VRAPVQQLQHLSTATMTSSARKLPRKSLTMWLRWAARQQQQATCSCHLLPSSRTTARPLCTGHCRYDDMMRQICECHVISDWARWSRHSINWAFYPTAVAAQVQCVQGCRGATFLGQCVPDRLLLSTLSARPLPPLQLAIQQLQSCSRWFGASIGGAHSVGLLECRTAVPWLHSVQLRHSIRWKSELDIGAAWSASCVASHPEAPPIAWQVCRESAPSTSLVVSCHGCPVDVAPMQAIASSNRQGLSGSIPWQGASIRWVSRCNEARTDANHENRKAPPLSRVQGAKDAYSVELPSKCKDTARQSNGALTTYATSGRVL
jgi:hypothetical protein